MHECAYTFMYACVCMCVPACLPVCMCVCVMYHALKYSDGLEAENKLQPLPQAPPH